VLDVHGAVLPAGPARLSFNCAFGGVLLAGQLHVDGPETLFLASEKGASFAQRRETFRVTVALPAAIMRRGRSRVPCTTLNLSIGGALLETERPLAHTGKLTVAIEYGDNRVVSLAAIVVRSEHAAMGLAVAFTSVDGAVERELSTLVAAAQRRALVSR
jgi:c-di-GMP-binding flagellar brake protein YcgR